MAHLKTFFFAFLLIATVVSAMTLDDPGKNYMSLN
jgi:hypothetical protein